MSAVLLALFFASGFVALLYQVIWQRLLGLVTGLDLYAVTLIVSVFMVGMGLGSVAGGYVSSRLPRGRLLLVFAAAETVVAMFALVSKPLYYDLLRSLAAQPNEFAGIKLVRREIGSVRILQTTHREHAIGDRERRIALNVVHLARSVPNGCNVGHCAAATHGQEKRHQWEYDG
jgi:hypothetical protein